MKIAFQVSKPSVIKHFIRIHNNIYNLKVLLSATVILLEAPFILMVNDRTQYNPFGC